MLIRHKKRGVPQKRGCIEERPAIVETNTETGHWEGDTVVGADRDGVLLTLVERVTEYTITIKLSSKQATFLATRLIAVLLKCPLPVRSLQSRELHFKPESENLFQAKTLSSKTADYRLIP